MECYCCCASDLLFACARALQLRVAGRVELESAVRGLHVSLRLQVPDTVVDGFCARQARVSARFPLTLRVGSKRKAKGKY